MSDQVSVGVIGTGFGAEILLPALAATPGVRIEAVCAAHRDRAEAAAARFGVPHATDDHHQLVAIEGLDLVCVCTPPHLHAEMSMDALEAGRHVFSTKPLATSLPEARELRDRAQRLGVVTAMDLDNRYEPVRRHSRALVRQGYLGELRFVVLTLMMGYTTDPNAHLYWWNWVASAASGGGILGASLLNHHLDLLRFTFGEMIEVSGSFATMVGEKPVPPPGVDRHHPPVPAPGMERRSVDSEDAVALHGRFSNGGLFTAAASWSVHHPTGVRVEAYGSEGTLILEPSGRLLGARAGDSGLTPLDPPSDFDLPPVADRRLARFHLLTADLAGAVRGDPGDPLFATFDDAFRLREMAAGILGR